MMCRLHRSTMKLNTVIEATRSRCSKREFICSVFETLHDGENPQDANLETILKHVINKDASLSIERKPR